MIDTSNIRKTAATLMGLAFAVSAIPAHAVNATRFEVQSAFPNVIQFAEIGIFENSVNRALPANGGLATATSSAGANYTPDHVNNGNIYDLYLSASGNGGEKLTITFDDRYYISFIVFNMRTDCCRDFDIYNYSLFDGSRMVVNEVLHAQGGDRWVVNFYQALPPLPGVPEPATWAMLITGLGAVGAQMRRRRANAMQAATPAN